MNTGNSNDVKTDFDNNKGTSEMLDNIEKSGSVTTRSDGINIHCLTIIGQIEGHYVLDNTQKATKYEHIIPLLTAVEEGEQIDGLLVVLNTQGGDVEAGLALSELIATMRKPTVSLVLGGGHSIGVPLAVSAKKSFIVPSATMTIHPVRTTGLVIGVEQSFEYLFRMQERICSFVTAHSKITKERLAEYMSRTDEMATDIGSIIDGYAAVECGLIDKVGGLGDALDELHNMIKEHKKTDISN